MLTVPNPFHAGVLIKKPDVSVSGKMYIILSLLSSSNLHHNPLWT